MTETYELLHRLEVTAAAELHLACRRETGGLVAIKRLQSPSSDAVERFVLEGKLLRTCAHPFVIELFELGYDRDGYFAVTEYVAGPSLAELARGPRPVPLHVALWLVRSLCTVLDHIHTRLARDGQPLDIVHHGIRPSNLHVAPSGHLKLIDFGDATIGGGTSDLRDDLRGVGVTAWELLVSQPLRAESSEPPSWSRPEIPPELDALVLSMLAADPQLRPRSALLLRKQLDAVIRCTCVNASALGVSRWLADRVPRRAAM